MTFFPSLPENGTLSALWERFPETAGPLAEYTETLMRGPSPLPPALRELIGAYVSGLNSTDFCRAVHTEAAQAFGIPKGLVGKLLENVRETRMPEKLEDKVRALLVFVRKLTLSPFAMTQADADQVFAQGWDEKALHDAVSVCALFNFYNRMVEGAGIQLDPDDPAAQALRFGVELKEQGYR